MRRNETRRGEATGDETRRKKDERRSEEHVEGKVRDEKRRGETRADETRRERTRGDATRREVKGKYGTRSEGISQEVVTLPWLASQSTLSFMSLSLKSTMIIPIIRPIHCLFSIVVNAIAFSFHRLAQLQTVQAFCDRGQSPRWKYGYRSAWQSHVCCW